jgi:hypothetical protein
MEQQCLICHEDFKLNYIKLECNHIYCTECFKAWFSQNKRQCCLCFKNFETFKEVKESKFEDLYKNSEINDIIEKNDLLTKQLNKTIEEKIEVENALNQATNIIQTNALMLQEASKHLEEIFDRLPSRNRKIREYEDLI